MVAKLAALLLGFFGLLLGPAAALADGVFPGKGIEELYDRIAADLHAGRPLVVTLYVALCDNDAQGIVKVKSTRLCRGDAPDENLYWAAPGGLARTLGQAGWQRVALQRASGALAIKAIWRKTVTAGGALRARGLHAPFDVYIVGRGYRGDRIQQAMLDYLGAVNRDDEAGEEADGRRLAAGGASHVVGYIGHDYFYDVEDPAPLVGLNRGGSVLPKGVFALACTGDRLIRPAIQRRNAHIFALNRTLGFPGAWTAEGAIAALAAGKDLGGIHRAAAAAFAAGKGVPVRTALAAFAFGDRPAVAAPAR